MGLIITNQPDARLQKTSHKHNVAYNEGLIFGFRQKNSREKNSKLKEKTQNSSKKLKNSAFDYFLDAEKRPKNSREKTQNSSKKKQEFGI